MHYCPECRNPYAEDDFACPRCGYSPSEEKTVVMKPAPQHVNETMASDPHGNAEGAAGSKAALWIAVSLGIVVFLAIVGITIYFLLGTGGHKAYEQGLKTEWQNVMLRSDELTQDANGVTTEAQLTPFAESLSDYRDFLVEEKAKVEAMQAPSDRTGQHKAIVEALGMMQIYIRAMKNDFTSVHLSVTEYEITPIDDSLAEAKASYKAALAANPFLEKLDEGFFKMHSTIGPAIAAARARAAASAKAAKLVAARRAAAEKARLAALKNKQKQQELEAKMGQAREVVTDFMSSILNANYTHAGSLLEGEAAGQYDPSIQGQGDFQITGYDVTSGEVTDLGNYRFYVTENDKDYSGAYFENKWKFVVNPKTMKIMRRQLMN